ncbi:hypothetical protein [Ulvibacter antarcticus]|uniref:Lipoprotein n=1 Tax=Ulvibacter antarcticus TaxID=442714 RepID=A0A3L9YYJ0_9FLAO|nr:hypothetical protein [Ulvibacter antarcticus]RMA64867.1 hypothetical protein BXY75_1752 [Ulvibacter antarcticus]
MRITYTLLFTLLLLVGCNSVKRNQKFLAQGNYDRAIDLAIKKLQKDKASEKNDAHIALLEEGFKKASEEDHRRITFLKKQNNPSNIKEVYHLYKTLNNRQELVRPLLPLFSQSLNRNAKFKLINYTDELISSKKELLQYLYSEATIYMNRQTIDDYRTAYNVFCEIDELQTNYKEVARLKEDARFLGTNFVFVTLNNRTGQIIPFRLERELLDFNTYGLDDFWTEYHNEREQGIEYHYGIALNFRQLDISPERARTTEVIRSLQIKTGWEYKRNRDGEIINDENGNPIKIDKFEKATAVLTVTVQTKGVLLGGNVIYRDLVNRRDIEDFPIGTEFVFENAFATYRGDKRALNNDDLGLINNHYVPFPTNEQMVLDAGEDLKSRLKDILERNGLD